MGLWVIFPRESCVLLKRFFIAVTDRALFSTLLQTIGAEVDLFPGSKISQPSSSYNLITGLQPRLGLLLHRPLQQPDLGHHLQQLLSPEQGEHAGGAQRDGQHGLPVRQQHAHQQRVHRHEPGQRRPRHPQGGHPVGSGPHRQRQNGRV